MNPPVYCRGQSQTIHSLEEKGLLGDNREISNTIDTMLEIDSELAYRQL